MVDKKEELGDVVEELGNVVGNEFIEAGIQYNLKKIIGKFGPLEQMYKDLGKLLTEYDKRNEEIADEAAPYLLGERTEEAVQRVASEKGKKYK